MVQMRRMLALAAVSALGAVRVEANPVVKVVQLLDQLTAKVVQEGEAEQKTYEEFAEWCEDTAKEKQFEISNGEQKSEDLSAVIEKAGSDITGAESKLEELAAVVTSHDGDLSSAGTIREKEAKDFTSEHSELVQVIDTLGRAINILKREASSGSFVQVANAQGLMQALDSILSASVLGSQDRARLNSLVQSSEDADEGSPAGSPSAATYENHSNSIISTLEDMLDKAEDMRAQAEKAEQNARHSFEMLSQSLKDGISFNQKEMDQAKKYKAAAQEAKAAAEGELVVTSKDLKEDKEYLGETHQSCMQKASDWDSSQRSRSEELRALTQAKDIISKMAGGAQVRSYRNMLQVTSKSQGDQPYLTAAHKLKQLGKQMDDQAMVQLAFRITLEGSSNDDPFTKVKGMIQEMIERLVADQQKEADHKAYCDKEMAETKNKIDDHSSTIDRLSAKVDKAAALISRLTEEVRVLQSELATLAKSQGTMDEIRREQHSEYTGAKKDFEEGLEGITMALKLLRDYYAAPKEAAAPVEGTHQAAAGGASGILGMLEVIEADFARNLADAQAGESAAAEEYKRVTQENRVSKAAKDQDVKYKNAARKRTESVVAETKEDRSNEQNELDAVVEYYERLRPTCVAKPESYVERKKRRHAEIAGLKEALEILEGEAVGFLQKRQ